jgi:hypothetical protein
MKFAKLSFSKPHSASSAVIAVPSAASRSSRHGVRAASRQWIPPGPQKPKRDSS